MERGLDTGNAHVEQDSGLVAPTTADTTVDAVPHAGRAPIHESVHARLRDRLGGRVARAELPTEQLAVILAELRWVVPDDLKVHHWLSHDRSSPRRRLGASRCTYVDSSLPRSEQRPRGSTSAAADFTPDGSGPGPASSSTLRGNGRRPPADSLG